MNNKLNDIEFLSKEWLDLKELEKVTIESRRKVEDLLLSLIGVPEFLDGQITVDNDLFLIKVTGRMNRKVDSEKLQELADENGLNEHLPSLFRWKPEINASQWKNASESITKPLLGAITTVPARASFLITIKE